SVLMLFEYYPGDAVLQAYLKEAIQNRLVSLPTFTSTFLLAARSRALREPGTLNLLCKTIQEARLWSDPSAAPATLFPEDPDLALGTVRDALELLRATYDPMLPAHHFQRVVGPVGNLVLSLTNPTPNFVSASGALALECIQSIKDILLHTFALDQNLRQPLENLALSLSLFLGENPGLTSRGSAYRSRSSLGQVDILGPGLENDITTCSLLFFQLIVDRAKSYGSGHETHATALLVAAFRTTAWPLQKFLIQLFQSAVACLSMDLSHMTSKRPLSLWNAFIAGRLPRLLVSFERALGMDGIPATEFRAALHEAWGTLCFEDPLSSSLAHYENMWSLVGATPSPESADKTVSFSSAFTYQLFSSGLLDQTFVVRIDPGLTSESPTRLQAEAREAGADFGHHLNQRFSDLTAMDAQVLLQRIYSDPISHATFAEIVRKRFDTASSSFDVETLGHISRVLAANETALDLVSLHVELSALVSGALAVVEEYDFEVVGDPQSAVGNLGDIVLFVQLATARFKISDTLKHKNRPLDMSYLRKTDAVLNSPVLTADETRALRTWFKALFDKNSEGIEDGVLRSTRPKTLLAVAATVFLTAVGLAAERKLDQDVLGNGMSYFLGPLLAWTLPGIMLALVREIRLKKFQSPQHLNVLRTLVLSPQLPRPVLSLCGLSVVRLLSEGRGVSHPYDVTALRIEVTKAMGITVAVYDLHLPESVDPMLDSPSLHCTDQPRRAIQNTLALIQSGKAPSLNVAACLVETSATDFLQTLWLELNLSIKAGMTIDAVKPLAVFILATPRGTLSPPLLPVFLHNVVPSLIDRSDNPITDDLELLIAIVSSSLMAALQLERTLYTTSGQKIYPLGSSSSSMARRLAVDLRYRKSSPKGGLVAQRLTSSQTFVTSFPVFKTEI
ncbi:mediator complex subunit Med5-domain-containing protein, partial [Lactarius vividus]